MAADRAQFSFFHPLRVRWSELDPQGIVFNPNYFVYFDVGITEYMRAIGFPYPAGLDAFGTDFFAVATAAEFHNSAVFDDELDIAIRTGRIGTTSLRFELAVFRRDTLLTSGSLTYVNAKKEGRAPTLLPGSFVERILAFERHAPERK